jgi:hypothetical protein
MKISINIPTYKRSKTCLTYKYLPSAIFWVHEFEVEEYKNTNPDMKIRVLPDDLRGNVAKVRNYILNNTQDDDVSVQMDDDTQYVAYWEQKQVVKLAEAELYLMIEKYSLLCKEWGYKYWGVNVNQDKQVYREYSPFSTLSYVSASFSCFLKGFDLRYDERFSLKEDYDLAIQVLNKYRGILRVNKYFYEHNIN